MDLEDFRNTPEYEKVLDRAESIFSRYIKHVSVGNHHTRIYNDFIDKKLKESVESKVVTLKEDELFLTFNDLEIRPPTYTYLGQKRTMTPQYARNNKLTYGVELYVDVRLEDANGKVLQEKTKKYMGTIPLMVKSRRCVLYKYRDDPRALELLGEDPNDPGGYFIVLGLEKTIFYIEILSSDKPILMFEKDAKNPFVRQTVEISSGTALIRLYEEKGIIRMEFPSMKKNVEGTEKLEGTGGDAEYRKKKKKDIMSFNALRIYRILLGQGGTNDILMNKIWDMIKDFIPEEHHSKCFMFLTPSLLKLFETESDMDFIMSLMLRDNSSDEEKEKLLSTILERDLFPDVSELPPNDGETEIEYKERLNIIRLRNLSKAISKILMYLAEVAPLDNRDTWSNKKLKGAAMQMIQLFRTVFRKAISPITKSRTYANMIVEEGKNDKINSITDNFNISVITLSFVESLTKFWGTKDSNPENKYSEPLERASLITQQSATGRINVSISRKDKNIEKRKISSSQHGFICCVSTPEGDNVGLIKDIAITASVTGMPDNTYILEVLKPYYTFAKDDSNNVKFDFNGKYIGYCKGEETRKDLIGLRRKNIIPRETSVIYEDDTIHVVSGSSRVVRPLLVVENGSLLLDELGLRDAPMEKIIESGAIDFLTPWEQEYVVIAYFEHEIEDYHEYCELHPSSMIGVVGNLIPFPNHNQGPRNSYQIQMGKQSLSLFHRNHRNRFDDGGNDAKMRVLESSEGPLCKTIAYDTLGLNEDGHGNNVFAALMAYPGTEEDAFVFKREALEAGLFRSYTYYVYKKEISTSDINRQRLGKPIKTSKFIKRNRYRHIQSEGVYAGLPQLGAFLEEKDCIIGIIDDSGIDNSVYLKVGEKGIVDKISVVNTNKELEIKVKIRIYTMPEPGDKFAPRCAQKGTQSRLIRESEMPSNKWGVSPDIIINTNCIPGRMTMSYIVEFLNGTYASYVGNQQNMTAFRPFNIRRIMKTLKKYNRDEFCLERMMIRETGRILKNKINCGLVYFAALKHQVKDKIQSRDDGPRDTKSKQPNAGKGQGGGLKFGTMEKDAIGAHGAIEFLRDKMMDSSDAYLAIFCICGEFAVNDPNSDGFKPCVCGRTDSFGKVKIPYALKTLKFLLGSAGIKFRLTLVREDLDNFIKMRLEEDENKSEEEEILTDEEDIAGDDVDYLGY